VIVDDRTRGVLEGLGVDPEGVPPGSVKVLGERELGCLGKTVASWMKAPQNREALAYAIDTEHESHIGLVLRNLFMDEKKSHCQIVKKRGTNWFNLHNALPEFYKLGVGVLVEGPKDALVLQSHGVPTVACLGVVPTSGHLKTLVRYMKAVLWIRDNDPPSIQADLRVRDTHQKAQKLGLNLISFPIPGKDPAELYKYPEYFTKISGRIQELSAFL
jgi:DNA primase